MSHLIHDFQEVLKGLNLSEREKSLFFKIFGDFLEADKKLPKWKDLAPIDISQIPSAQDLETPEPTRAKELLNNLVVCKLNGGLGTSMGCAGPKSTIEVWKGKSFLDLIVNQIEHLNDTFGCSIPLVLMNSFHTHGETRKIIRRYGRIETRVFNQNSFYRIHSHTKLPLTDDETSGFSAKYPPGHGDFYFCEDLLMTLKDLKATGKKYLFVSNSDNLAATVNLEILDYLAKEKVPMLMEVTRKTKSDVKGGSLVHWRDRLHLLELAQVPEDRVKEFQNIRTFSNFNTNNLWFSIESLIDFMESEPSLNIFANRKTVNQFSVIQLEMAIGSAIGKFENAQLMKVSRDRFLPVKKTDDLFLLRSNLFEVENGKVHFQKKKAEYNLPFVRLGEYCQNYEDYCKRIKEVPDISELDQLTIVGDVRFGAEIVLKGNVIFICENGTLQIPDGSVFNNQIISGKLNIDDF